jgi:phosphatidylserine/phosphatidylglycerophosphate/cardiolipin synthase-like enzyme
MKVLNHHQYVPASIYSTGAVKLPPPEEVPNLDVEVVNYHRPLLGTFHAKFMVVDRKIAIVQSNNIQDNDNLEMMTHIEGPVVDSIYDVALISWHNALAPPFPCLQSSVSEKVVPTFEQESFKAMFDDNGQLKTLRYAIAIRLRQSPIDMDQFTGTSRWQGCIYDGSRT